ncbi:hypothetical protein BDN70DRAFT_881054 [Pholiota conissans]|uniref:Fungal-type protein kinase domain-containing protein n=1 Tax=Pholiota conissans TaxID=109636 RepID=A0A9P5YZV7_9AGAR|nr:hypothetical protein BDN70DRAFT_881054 [Pholiota conissans]
MAYLPHIDDPFVFCDSTVFSDLDSSDSELVLMSEGIKFVETSSAVVLAPTIAAHVFPVLPPAHNFSVLGNPTRFAPYIQSEIPLAATIKPHPSGNQYLQTVLPTLTDSKLRRGVNSTFINTLLKRPKRAFVVGGDMWIDKDIFPDSKLPVPFDHALIKSSPLLWLDANSKVATRPEMMTEESVALWLSQISNILATILKKPNSQFSRLRDFDARSATMGPSGGYMLRKPDISVIDHASSESKNPAERLHWRKIYAFVEVTSNNSNPVGNVLKQITEKAACIFDVQPQREFVCALGIIGNTPNVLKYTLVIVDRAGVAYTKCAELNGYSGLNFLKIVFAFCFASVDAIGWDMSMHVNPKTNEIRAIDVTGCENDSDDITTVRFYVVKLIHSSPILFSRGTRVWLVKDANGIFYVLKDSWVYAENMNSEIGFMRHIAKTLKNDKNSQFLKHTLPSYRIGQDCVSSTNTIRGDLFGKPPCRYRRRIVTSTIGDPITSFRSKKEFVSTYIDIVNALEFLNTKADVIHGDLSINNILINRVWNHTPDNTPSKLRSLAFQVGDADTTPNISGSNEQNNLPTQSVQISAPVPAPAPAPAPAVCVQVVSDNGTVEPIEAAGLLIDYDFMRDVNEDTHQTSGTLPFMAIESLKPTAKNCFKHNPGHDLESLLNTMLTLCLYTTGPGGQLRVAVEGDQHIKFNKWFSISDRFDLAIAKSITLEAFELLIKPHLPEYWQDFAPFLHRLIEVTWNDKPFLMHPNCATHQAYRNILKEALEKYSTEETRPLAPYAAIPINKQKRHAENGRLPPMGKRQRTSEMVAQTQTESGINMSPVVLSQPAKIGK